MPENLLGWAGLLAANSEHAVLCNTRSAVQEQPVINRPETISVKLDLAIRHSAEGQITMCNACIMLCTGKIIWPTRRLGWGLRDRRLVLQGLPKRSAGWDWTTNTCLPTTSHPVCRMIPEATRAARRFGVRQAKRAERP